MRLIELFEAKPAKKPEINNLVAKHARTFNKATVQADKKKKSKKGYQKHKNKDNS